MWFMLNTYLLSFWKSRILVHAKQRMPTWLAPRKSPGHWVSLEPPWQMAFYMCCHSLLVEELNTSYVTQLGEDSWKLAPGFLQTLSHPPFPFADFALWAFTIRSHSMRMTICWDLGVLLVNHWTQKRSWGPQTGDKPRYHRQPQSFTNVLILYSLNQCCPVEIEHQSHT